MAHNTSFIKIEAGKLTLGELPKGVTDDAPVRVISILGKARMGKSTFLNCMIAALGESESYVFPTQETDEHCTFGIDTYAIPSQNLILLDCQGVEYDDSSQDSKLLLLTYLLSDVVIFNERNMLSNATLNSFQPMMAFLQYLELEHLRKPNLLFRISDVDLELDATKSLASLLRKKRDQFQNIRDSIKDLFINPVAVKTNSLDRSEKALLRNHDYAAMLKVPENRFAAAIDAIRTQVVGLKTEVRTFRAWAAAVPGFIAAINSNEKIDYKKLDVVELLAYKELNEWLQGLDADLYAPIAADGLAATESTVLRPREAAVAAKLADFKRHFSALPESLVGPRYEELQARLEVPIVEAKAAMLQKAKDMAVVHLKTHYCCLNHKFDSNNESLARNFIFDSAGYLGLSPSHPFIDSLFFAKSKYKTPELYSVVSEAGHKWRLGEFQRINNAIHKALEIENAEYLRAQTAAETFRDTILDTIKRRKLTAGHLCIKDSIETVLVDIIENCKEELRHTMNSLTLKSVQVAISFTEGYLQPFSIISSVTEERKILSPRLNELVEGIGAECEAIVRSSEIPKIILAARRRLMSTTGVGVRRGAGLGPFESKLLEMNPSVEFVSFAEPQVAWQNGMQSVWYQDLTKSEKVSSMMDTYQYLFMTRDQYHKKYKATCNMAINLMLFDRVVKNYFSALNLFHRVFVTKRANHRTIDLTVRGKTRRDYYFAETFRSYYMKAALIVEEVA